MIIASQEYAEAHGLPYLAIIRDSVEVGIDPAYMGISPIKAIQKLLARNQLTTEEIDLYEINEAFAATSIVVQRELALPEEKVNIYGGGISLGHAIGATGARLLTSLSYQLNQKEKEIWSGFFMYRRWLRTRYATRETSAKKQPILSNES